MTRDTDDPNFNKEFLSAQTTQDILNGKGTKDDLGKPKYNDIFKLLHLPFINDVAKVIRKGLEKYEKDNWKKNLEKERIENALIRHLIAYLNGEKLDQESKLPHLCHITANAMFLHYYDYEGKESL